MREAVPVLAALLALAACDGRRPEPRVTVEDAVVTLPVLPGRPGAAYFTLRTNNEPTQLVGIASPRVARIELHETARQAGVVRMRPVRDTNFSPDAPLAFAPGGRHAMLLGIDPALRAGDILPLTFTFDPAPAVTVEAQVRAAGGADAAH